MWGKTYIFTIFPLLCHVLEAGYFSPDSMEKMREMHTDFLSFSLLKCYVQRCRLGLGWRGGVRYANRRFQREQMKLLGQLKPGRWPLKLFKRPILRRRLQENADKISEPIEKDALAQHSNWSKPHCPRKTEPPFFLFTYIMLFVKNRLCASILRTEVLNVSLYFKII